MRALRRPRAGLREPIALAALCGGAIAAAAKARGTDTHGRWPWIAALAAPPAAVAVIAGPLRSATDAEAATWASLPLLLCHETEEWVLPSGFLPWFNRSVWKSDDDEFPLTRVMGFRINVLVGWGLSALAVLTVKRTPLFAAAVLVSEAGNGLMHVGLALRQRRYNPGFVTALVMGPLGAVGTARIVSRRRGPAALAGVAFGALASLALPASLHRRMRAATAA